MDSRLGKCFSGRPKGTYLVATGPYMGVRGQGGGQKTTPLPLGGLPYVVLPPTGRWPAKEAKNFNICLQNSFFAVF